MEKKLLLVSVGVATAIFVVDVTLIVDTVVVLILAALQHRLLRFRDGFVEVVIVVVLK